MCRVQGGFPTKFGIRRDFALQISRVVAKVRNANRLLRNALAGFHRWKSSCMGEFKNWGLFRSNRIGVEFSSTQVCTQHLAMDL
jgi:hypothetical protein